MASRPIPVRVVPIVETRALGWIAAGGDLALLAFADRIGFRDENVILVAVAIASLATLLVWRPAPRTTTLVVEKGIVRLGGRACAKDVVDASVARGERGWSVLAPCGPGDEALFLEVDTEADARAVLDAFGIAWPGGSTVEVVARDEGLRIVQRALGVFGLLALVLAVLMEARPGWDGVARVLGPLALVATILTGFLFVLDGATRRRFEIGPTPKVPRAGAKGRGIVDVHLRAHLEHRIAPTDEDASVSDRATARATSQTLDRGDETTRAWLARVDALGGASRSAAAREGYRLGGPSEDELWAIVDDAEASELARLGAMRLLRRCFSLDVPAPRARIAEERAAVVRIVVETESVEEAASELDDLGPRFAPRRASKD